MFERHQDKIVADIIIYSEKLVDVELVNEMKISYKKYYQHNQIVKAKTQSNHQYPEKKIKRKKVLIL